jgi:hypothetical protein
MIASEVRVTIIMEDCASQLTGQRIITTASLYCSVSLQIGTKKKEEEASILG